MSQQTTLGLSLIFLSGVMITSCKKESETEIGGKQQTESVEKQTNPSPKIDSPAGFNTIPEEVAPIQKLELTHNWTELTDEDKRWQERVKILQNVDYTELTEDDLSSLYQIVRQRPPTGSSRKREQWYVVANEVLEQMRKNGVDKENFSSQLLSIAQDRSVDSVVRDYSIQHLGMWLLPRGKQPVNHFEEDSEMVTESIKTLTELVQNPSVENTSVPGTILRVLVDMKQSQESATELDGEIEKLEPYFRDTLSLLSDVQHFSRLTPIQQATTISVINTVSELELDDHVELIRSIAKNTDSDPTLRLNSISALGNIGSEDDQEFLTTLSTTPEEADTRYRFAAQTALKNLIEQ